MILCVSPRKQSDTITYTSKYLISFLFSAFWAVLFHIFKAKMTLHLQDFIPIHPGLQKTI